MSEIPVLLSLLLLAAVIVGSLVGYSYSVLREVQAEKRALAANEKLIRDR